MLQGRTSGADLFPREAHCCRESVDRVDPWVHQRRQRQAQRPLRVLWRDFHNYRSMERFRHLVGKLWFLALRRRSQRAKRTWEWFDRLLTVFPLPKPIIHQRWFGA
jgi:hypothetical protein